MRILKCLQELQEKEKRCFADNKEAVAETNRKTIKVIFAISLFCYALCFLMSFYVKVYAQLRYLYLGGLVALVAALLLYRLLRIKNPVPFATALYGLIVLYAAFAGSFVTPKYIGVIILICLFEFPVFILSYRSYIIAFEAIFASLYLIIVVPHKWDFIVADEIVNTVVFMIIGIITGIYFQSIRLNNLELIRKRGIDRVTDETTGLYNRRRLFEYFIEFEKNQSAPYALAMLDIDWFKAYNDTYGHLAGDHCLARLGSYFSEFGERNGMTFYRYGGEEFVAVVWKKPHTDEKELFCSLTDGVYGLKIESKKSVFEYVTVSVGFVRMPPETSGVNPEAVLERADKALYAAKNSGRNKAVSFDSDNAAGR